MKDLTMSESMLLLAIFRLGENAYGVKIRQKVAEVTDRTYSYGTLYSSLDQLVKKRYVQKTIGDPTPERGGRSKIYYRLSAEGVEALQNAYELQKAIWNGISDIAVEKGRVL